MGSIEAEFKFEFKEGTIDAGARAAGDFAIVTTRGVTLSLGIHQRVALFFFGNGKVTMSSW